MTDLAQGQIGTWYLVIAVNGNLVSEGGQERAALAPSDVLSANADTVVKLDHRPDPLVERWDPVTRTLVRTLPTLQPVVAADHKALYDQWKQAADTLAALQNRGATSDIVALAAALTDSAWNAYLSLIVPMAQNYQVQHGA